VKRLLLNRAPVCAGWGINRRESPETAQNAPILTALNANNAVETDIAVTATCR